MAQLSRYMVERVNLTIKDMFEEARLLEQNMPDLAADLREGILDDVKLNALQGVVKKFSEPVLASTLFLYKNSMKNFTQEYIERETSQKVSYMKQFNNSTNQSIRDECESFYKTSAQFGNLFSEELIQYLGGENSPMLDYKNDTLYQYATAKLESYKALERVMGYMPNPV